MLLNDHCKFNISQHQGVAPLVLGILGILRKQCCTYATVPSQEQTILNLSSIHCVNGDRQLGLPSKPNPKLTKLCHKLVVGPGLP